MSLKQQFLKTPLVRIFDSPEDVVLTVKPSTMTFSTPDVISNSPFVPARTVALDPEPHSEPITQVLSRVRLFFEVKECVCEPQKDRSENQAFRSQARKACCQVPQYQDKSKVWDQAGGSACQADHTYIQEGSGYQADPPILETLGCLQNKRSRQVKSHCQEASPG